MQIVAALAFAFFISASLAENVDTPRDRKNYKYKCYTCLGRDLDNCEYGQVTCELGCMKVVDTKYNVIAKGCKNTTYNNNPSEKMKTDGGDIVTLPEVKLTWEEHDPSVEGQIYFCDNPPEFCNGVVSLIIPSIAIFLCSLFSIFRSIL